MTEFVDCKNVFMIVKNNLYAPCEYDDGLQCDKHIRQFVWLLMFV